MGREPEPHRYRMAGQALALGQGHRDRVGDELQANLHEVSAMLLEDGEPQLEADFVDLQQIFVAS